MGFKYINLMCLFHHVPTTAFLTVFKESIERYVCHFPFPYFNFFLFAFLTFKILHDLIFAFMVIYVCQLLALTVVKKKANFLYRID